MPKEALLSAPKEAASLRRGVASSCKTGHLLLGATPADLAAPLQAWQAHRSCTGYQRRLDVGSQVAIAWSIVRLAR